jgi:hypothetical protein
VSASFCVATGDYDNGSVDQTLIEVWDGAVWTLMTSPNVGGDDNRLRSVSCVSTSFCVATGDYKDGSANQTLVLSLTGPVPPSTTTTTVSPDQVVPAFTG